MVENRTERRTRTQITNAELIRGKKEKGRQMKVGEKSNGVRERKCERSLGGMRGEIGESNVHRSGRRDGMKGKKSNITEK